MSGELARNEDKQRQEVVSFTLSVLTENEVSRVGEARQAIADRTRERIRESVPEETRRAYDGDWTRFTDWCSPLGYQPLPATPDVLAYYATHLADEGKAPATIDRAIAAILTAHESAGIEKPATEPARAVLKQYRHEIATDENGRTVRKAPPVTITKLRGMVATCAPESLAGLRDRALIVAGFACGARRSELAALNIRDVEFVEEGVILNIRTSKADKESRGRRPKLIYGNHPETCPVRTLRAWLDALAQRGITSGPLFRRIDRHGVLGRAPNGRGDPQGRLTGQGALLIVRRAAKRAGIDHASAFTGHSLRSGFATETYRAGANPVWIADQGGWDRKSKAMYGYLHEVDGWKDNPLTEVGL